MRWIAPMPQQENNCALVGLKLLYGRSVFLCFLPMLTSFLFNTDSFSVVAESAMAQTTSSWSQVQNLYKTGMVLVQKGLLDEAIKAFERGLDLEPTNLVL